MVLEELGEKVKIRWILVDGIHQLWRRKWRLGGYWWMVSTNCGGESEDLVDTGGWFPPIGGYWRIFSVEVGGSLKKIRGSSRAIAQSRNRAIKNVFARSFMTFLLICAALVSVTLDPDFFL